MSKKILTEINIISSADENYAQHLGVMIFSLLDSADDPSRIKIFILDGGIDENNKKKLIDQVKIFKSSLEFIEIDKSKFGNFKISDHISHAAYYRIIIPELFGNLEKVLYLDCDLIIKRNIAELWDTNLGDSCLAAVEDAALFSRNKELEIPEGSRYFNSGVMLIDIEKWKKNGISKKIFEFLSKKNTDILWWDQDGLNGILYDKWMQLSPIWNQQRDFFAIKDISYLGFSQKNFTEALTFPAIIHFTTRSKPWQNLDDHPLKYEYLFYLNQSLWKGSKLAGPTVSQLIQLKDNLIQDKENENKDLLGDLNGKDSKIENLSSVIEEKDRVIKIKDLDVFDKNEVIKHKDSIINNQNSVIESKDNEIAAKKRESELVKKQLDAANKQFDLISKQLDSKVDELSKIYSCRGWKTVILLRYIIDVVVPVGSQRRKISSIIFRAGKKFFEFLLKIKRKCFYWVRLSRKAFLIMKRNGVVFLGRKILYHFELRIKEFARNNFSDGFKRFLKAHLFKKDRISLEQINNKKWHGPLISIVIPCFNYGKYINEAIDSVLGQTFENYEILVIDGGSTDEYTLETLKKINNLRVKVFLREGSHLVGDNRNYGISLANGKYICCLDADDKIAPTYLEKASFYLEALGYDVVYPSVQCFGESNEIWITGPITFEHMINVNNSVSTVAVFSREAWKKINGYKDWPIGNGHVPEDWEFWTRLMGNGFRFRNLKEPLMLYRVHKLGLTSKNQTSSEGQRLVIYEENKALLDKKYKKLREKNLSTRYVVKDPFINLDKLKPQKRILITFSYFNNAGDFLKSVMKLLEEYKITILFTDQTFANHNYDLSKFRNVSSEAFCLADVTDSDEEQYMFVRYLLSTRKFDLVFNSGSDLIDRMSSEIKSWYPGLKITGGLFTINHTETLNKDDVEYEILKRYYSNAQKGVTSDNMFTLSIVLNLHKEGLIAERTIINLIDTLAYNKLFGLWNNIEVVVVLDNHDELTKNIVYKYKDVFDKIELVNFRDLGRSRNHGVSVATNNFVLFADGDDLVSINCISELYVTTVEHYKNIASDVSSLSMLDYSQHIAVFHKALIEFPNMYIQEYTCSNNILTENSMFQHFYTSKIMCLRELLLKNKVRENASPYGSEDWDLNNRLLSLGVEFETASYYLYYRRIDDNSMSKRYFNERNIVRNSDIYTINFIHSRFAKSSYRNGIETNTFASGELATGIMEDHKKFLKSYGEDGFSIKSEVVGNFNRQLSTVLPDVKIYEKLLDFLKDKDFVFFAPWIVLGGADKLVVEYIDSLGDTDYKPCLITTINSGERISSISIPHFDINSACPEWKDIPIENQSHILMKALMNSPVKSIHIVNSIIALQLIKYYKDIFLEYKIKTIVSLFCPDYDWENNEYHGYPVMYPEVMRNADIILSDNQYWYKLFKELAGRDFKYQKLFSPIDEAPKIKTAFSKNKKILWASRISNQKLIGVLYSVCKKRPDITFVIYGNGQNEEPANSFFDKLLKLKNVDYRGIYNSYDELDMNEFDLLLFTSKFEGIAFVRLDMINHNVPIITSDVGDSSEIFGDNYELLVKNVDDVDEYCKKIDEYYSNPKYYYDKVTKIRKYIVAKHSRALFRKEYVDVIKNKI